MVQLFLLKDEYLNANKSRSKGTRVSVPLFDINTATEAYVQLLGIKVEY